METALERRKTVGITLLKTVPAFADVRLSSPHRTLLLHLHRIRNKVNGLGQTQLDCPNRYECIRNFGSIEDLVCENICIDEVLTMLGHFDFMVVTSSDRMECIEWFWITCVRDVLKLTLGDSAIVDTQTLIGVRQESLGLDKYRDVEMNWIGQEVRDFLVKTGEPMPSAVDFERGEQRILKHDEDSLEHIRKVVLRREKESGARDPETLRMKYYLSLCSSDW